VKSLFVFYFFAVATSVTPARGQTPDACQSLVSQTLQQARVIQAQEMTSGVFAPPEQSGVSNYTPVKNLPAFCRVLVQLTPSADSDINSEVWLPENWNGRLQMLGNGGWAGVISYSGLAEAIRSGYAAVATDAGHKGNRALFALGHPAKLIDFGYRAVHESVLKAKTIIASYYGKTPAYSYWNSCSTGGRQGLMEAQRFPTDFDGIIAGAPASDMYRLHTAWMWDFFTVHESPDSVIPAVKLPTIQRAAIAACDARDGVTDGLISDPLSCHFDPKSMICAGEDSAACLTPAQATAVSRIYNGMTRPHDTTPIYPGPEPGSEFGWAFHSGETLPGQPPRDTYGYAIYQDANWDWHSFNLEAALEQSVVADGGRIAATDPDLRPFFSRGGKLLLYHGWSDPNIPPRNTINYYQSVIDKLGGLEHTDESMRLFLLPGMGHCGGGYGPNRFDGMDTISAWVEHGRAPERIVARRENAGKIERTRPICVYPRVAKYTGSGSLDDAANFACTVPTAVR
jgi:Tannase and feruloyl esterase